MDGTSANWAPGRPTGNCCSDYLFGIANRIHETWGPPFSIPVHFEWLVAERELVMSRVDFTADLRVLFKFPTWRAYHMILLYFDLWQMNLFFFYTTHQYLQQIAERYQWLSPIGYLFLIIRFMRRVEYYLSNLRRDWLGSGLSTYDRFPLVVNLAGNLVWHVDLMNQ